MKTVFVIILAHICLLTSNVNAQQTTPLLIVEKAELQVNGLTCSMCNLSVYKSLEHVPFIDSIKTQLNSSVYTLVIKTGQSIDPMVLKKQVEAAGFSIGKLRLFFKPMEVNLTKDQHLAYGDFYFHVLSSPASNENWTAEIKDKKFISAKEFNTLQKSIGHKCYKTGVTGDCCSVAEGSKNIYHLSF